MGNALKFTPSGGRIDVTAAADGDLCVLTVRDTGAGMSPERVAMLNRGDRRTQTTLGTAGEKGSGLGFTLCREVIARIGGTLHVDSAEGAGTTITVTMPRARPASPADAASSRDAHPTQVVNR